MKPNRWLGGLLSVFVIGTMGPAMSAEEPLKLPDSIPARSAVLDGFVAACQKNAALNEAQRQAALATIASARAPALTVGKTGMFAPSTS